MAIRRYRPEQIIAKLREADVLLSQGHSVSLLSLYPRMRGFAASFGLDRNRYQNLGI